MKTTTTLALAASLALVAGASFAQQPPGPPPGPGQAWGERREHMRPDPAQMAERHAERLRAALQLRPEQEPALRAFVEATQPAGPRDERRFERRGADTQPLTTPERLDRMRERLVQRQAAFDRRAAATKRFYAQLSPSQQRAFDAMPMRGGPGGRRGGFGHGPRGGFRG